jgi:hypothetical protein
MRDDYRRNPALGMIANTAALMGATIGKLFPDAIGPDVFDQAGDCHSGIVAIPIPMMKGNPALLTELRGKLYDPKFAELAVVDFSDVAQSCNTYDAFVEKLTGTPRTDLRYFGIAICGNKKLINQLTGSMGLLR